MDVEELRSENVHGSGLGGKYLRRLNTYSADEIRQNIFQIFQTFLDFMPTWENETAYQDFHYENNFNNNLFAARSQNVIKAEPQDE